MAKQHPQDELLNHDYDGITEYDNQLPGWWKMLFYVSIAFAFVYLLYYHVFGIGDSSRVEYLKEMNPQYAESGDGSIFFDYRSPFFDTADNLTPRAKEELRKIADAPFEIAVMRAMSKATPEQLTKLKAAFPDIAKAYETGGLPALGGAAAAPEAPAITVPLKDAASLDDGKKLYTIHCVSCHGNAGQGNIGPNLTDEYWIHGGTLPQVIRTIRKGVLEKGMLQWEKTLTPEQIDHVASFIMVKLQGSTPPNPKAPQGEKFVPPTETAAPADAKTAAAPAAKDAKTPPPADAKKK